MIALLARRTGSGANGVSASEKTTGPAPGPPPPCGRREGLVEVDVHRVDAEVARPDAADDRVEIGAVAIDQRRRRRAPPREISIMSGSNRPHVLGLVIITAGDVRPQPRLERVDDRPGRGRWPGYSRPGSRRRPRWRDWCRARFPGRASTSRASPRASSAERIASRPHNSPCAPALGLIATLCMPVSVTSHSPSMWISCERALDGVDRLRAGGCRRSRAAAPSSR